MKIKNLLRCSLVSVLLIQGIPLLASPVIPKEKKENGDANEQLLKQISRGFSKVAKKAIPAVVYIESEVEKEERASKQTRKGSQENPFDYFHDEFFNHFFGLPHHEEPKARKPETVRGSGFFVGNEGYIITNNHVVENAKKVTVTLDGGKKLVATIVGTDPKTDLAVIKVEEKGFPHLSFGNSDALEVGDWAIAVGTPFGLEATVTVGVVSAKGRNQLHITDFEDFIQTDAAINPGNSGGPLLNVDGEVIGINTAIVSGSGGYMGIGFAIPSNMAVRIMEQLIKEGVVTRGFLGVTLQPIDTDLANFYKLSKVEGALITDVTKGSPADNAKLMPEDIILSYNNSPVDNLTSFRNAVSLMTPGSKLILKVLREGKMQDVVVVISSNPENIVPQNPLVQKLGLQVQNLDSERGAQLGYENQLGVLVTDVRQDGSAFKAGLRQGDLIMAVNRVKINNVEEFNEALQKALKEGSILFMVRHKEMVRFIILQIE